MYTKIDHTLLLYVYVLQKIERFLHKLYKSVQYFFSLKCSVALRLNSVASMVFFCLYHYVFDDYTEVHD